ncbi:MAG: bifunctional 4-hydroxy-2-oxoglutarate aldolase/2-dehydro-3-deoxy-phosphogluconate aldolase [Dehalococcoidia bacterium]
MTRPRTRLGLATAILDCGLMPNFATTDFEIALGVARATWAGGCPVLEFLNRGVGAAAVFARLAEQMRTEAPDLLLGAGTVTEPGSAAEFINAGAAFIVGPNSNPAVAAVCGRMGIPYVPGCGTVTEIGDAMAAGSDIVKFFPAPFLGGPAAVKALLGPYPHLVLLPSGGVETSEAALRDWFDAGVGAVSVGAALISSELVGRRDWDELAARTAEVMAIVRAARKLPR